MLALLACTAAPLDTGTLPLDTGPAASEVEVDWGIVGECDSAPNPGFDRFYGSGSATLVHGTDPQDAAFAEQIAGFYGAYVDLELVAWDALTEEQRAGDLMILGHVGSNGLLRELNGTLPVWFEAHQFTFGGYRYAQVGEGVALIHPNPWGQDRWLTVYAGNGYDGAFAPFTVSTGQLDYVTVHGRGTVHQTGTLCQDGDAWTFMELRDTDHRADWRAYWDSLEVREGLYHIHHYEWGSVAATNIDELIYYQDVAHGDALELLGWPELDGPIHNVWYSSNADKERQTGNGGNAHANVLVRETHHVFGSDVQAGGSHEDVHVLAWNHLGDTGYALMGEGLAVWVGGVWWGEPLHDWVADWLARGELIPLQDLVDDFWSNGDAQTYPTAGHFVGFVAETYGLPALEALYVAPDLEAAFQSELGLTLSQVEEAWHASILGE